MTDAGFELSTAEVQYGGPMTLIQQVRLGGDLSPEMLAQSEECILEVNDGVHAPTVSLP